MDINNKPEIRHLGKRIKSYMSAFNKLLCLAIAIIMLYILACCAAYGQIPPSTRLVLDNWLSKGSVGDYVPEGNDLDYSPLGRKAMVNFRDYAASLNPPAATVWGRNVDIAKTNKTALSAMRTLAQLADEWMRQ